VGGKAWRDTRPGRKKDQANRRVTAFFKEAAARDLPLYQRLVAEIDRGKCAA